MRKLLSLGLVIFVLLSPLLVSCYENENDEDLNMCKISVDYVGKGEVKISKYLETSENVLKDSEIEVIAVPDKGYAFIGWYVGDAVEPISTDAVFSFIATKDIKLTARFVELIDFNIHSTEYGTVALKGLPETSSIVPSGSEVTVVATPDDNCAFIGWYVGDAEEPVSTDVEYTFKITKDVVLTARFYPISYITIEQGLDSVYDICESDILIISPVIAQTNLDKPLSYTWEVNLQPYSHDEFLEYVAEEVGQFECRFIVENEDDKVCFPFVINVGYGSGIAVLSKDAEGRSCLSYMQEPMKEGGEKMFYNENCFEKNNPDIVFASNASDIIQTNGSIIIACQGKDGVADDNATIYFLNEKTFVMENLVDGSEYPTFIPTKLLIPSKSYEGAEYPVLSADGKMYSLTTRNAVLQPLYKLAATYAQTCFVDADNSGYYDIIMWDKEINALALIYNGYGPFYCGSQYLCSRDYITMDDYYVKYFSKLKSVKTLTLIRRTPEQKKTSHREFIAIVEAPLFWQKVILSSFFWEYVENRPGEYNVLDNGGFVKAAKRNYSLINEQTPCIANATYKTMLFPDGNKVMRWYYDRKTNGDGNMYCLEDADVLCTVGSSKAVITAFEISDDHKQTYVAFYEPEQEDKNGSVWVIDTDSGVVLEKYNNICYRPVKMLLKSY